MINYLSLLSIIIFAAFLFFKLKRIFAKGVIVESVEPTTLSSNGCKVVSGKWNDPFTGATFTDPKKLDVDHMVPVPTKNPIRFDSIRFFPEAIVASRNENDYPSPPFCPARTAPKPRPLTPRNPGASPAAGHGKPKTTQASSLSLESAAILDLPLPPVAGMSSDTAGL